MKEIVNESTLNESTKKVYAALKAKDLKITEGSSIAFMYEEHESRGYILFNFNATGIYFDRSELDMNELRDGGIKVWPEWYLKF